MNRFDPQSSTHRAGDPLTPDQLLDYENIRASEPVPQHLLDSMSERRVHVSSVDEAEDLALEDLAKSLETTASFRLPANTFLGQLGRDGRTQVSVPATPESDDPVVRPFQPAWQDRVYHPKLAPMPLDAVVKGRDAERIRVHRAVPTRESYPVSA